MVKQAAASFQNSIRYNFIYLSIYFILYLANSGFILSLFAISNIASRGFFYIKENSEHDWVNPYAAGG